MDECIVLMWVERVLQPYITSALEGIVPILLLNMYHCHMMTTVVTTIKGLGVEVENITGGCTGFCQLINAGISKSLKSNIQEIWTEWMIQEGLRGMKMSRPSREEVANWMCKSYFLKEKIVRNSWGHSKYSWFI